MPRLSATLLASLVVLACEIKHSAPPLREVRSPNMDAATALTNRYAASRFAGWKLQAYAAGSDCGVLLVETGVVLEDSMVEAIHYGTGSYNVYEGGIQRFYRERSFRGVAYRDRSGHIWTYGAVGPVEAAGMSRCR